MPDADRLFAIDNRRAVECGLAAGDGRTGGKCDERPSGHGDPSAGCDHAARSHSCATPIRHAESYPFAEPYSYTEPHSNTKSHPYGDRNA